MSQNDPRQLAWFEYPFDRSRREKWEVKDRILYAVYLRAFQCLAKLDVAGVEKTPKDADIVYFADAENCDFDMLEASQFNIAPVRHLFHLAEIRDNDFFSDSVAHPFLEYLTAQEGLFCEFMRVLMVARVGILAKETNTHPENIGLGYCFDKQTPIDFSYFKRIICNARIGELLPTTNNLIKFDRKNHAPTELAKMESWQRARARAEDTEHETEKQAQIAIDDNKLRRLGYPYEPTYTDYLRFLETNFSGMMIGGVTLTWADIAGFVVPFFAKSFPNRYELAHLHKRHTYIVGRGGSGKTVLLRGIFQSLKKGIPRIVIDPHGDLADDLSCFHKTTYRIAPHERPFVINPFEIRDKSLGNRELVGQLITDMIGELVADVELSRLMETVIFPVVVTLLKLDYADFRMLADCINPNTGKDRLKSLRGYVDSHLLGVWGELEGKTYDTSKQSIFNRLQSLLNYRTVIQTLCGKDDFGEVEKVLHSGGEIVFSIPVPAVGEAVAVTLGRFFVTRMQIWAKQRQAIPERERFPVYLMIDEFHNFISPVFASTLDQYGRKFGLFLMLAHQHIKQLGDSEIKGSILTNTQNKIVGMSNHETRQALQREMSADAEQFEGLRVGHFLAKFGEEEAIQIYCRNQRPLQYLSAPQYLPTRNTGELFNGWTQTDKGDQNFEASEKPVTARAGGYTPKFDI